MPERDAGDLEASSVGESSHDAPAALSDSAVLSEKWTVFVQRVVECARHEIEPAGRIANSRFVDTEASPGIGYSCQQAIVARH